MGKRITKKLTDRVKEKIKKDYRSLHLKDFDGEALVYLRKVRGAAKGRKAKADSVARVEDLAVPKDSEMYSIIVKSAKMKKMTVKQFMKRNKDAIKEFMKDGDIVLPRVTEYLIGDINKLAASKKVFVNDGNGYTATSHKQDILHIQLFTQHILQHTDIFMIVYRVHFKLNGDLTHYLPPDDEYGELEEASDLEEMLDTYYPEITYLKSAKSHAKKEKPKRIKPYSKERKKQTQSKHGNKRPTNNRVFKKS